MLAVEWIDRAKDENKIKSDYEIAKRIGITRQAMSYIRNKKTHTLGLAAAQEVAVLLGLNPDEVIADQARERYMKQAGFGTPLFLGVLVVFTACQYILC